jgi:hypothetical protein
MGKRRTGNGGSSRCGDEPRRFEERVFVRDVVIGLPRWRDVMAILKLLAAAAILAGAVATSATGQEATQEPGALGQSHPYVDYLTGGYGVRGTSRGQYGSYDGDYGPADVVVGIVPGGVTVIAPDAYAYYGGCEPGTWYIGRDGLRRFCR